jgi:hypothetical protein
MGMGRRQLAIEYAHRFRADYDLVWWVPAVTRHLAATSLARLAHRLELPAENGAGVEAAAKRALSALDGGTTRHRWLLIYDDAIAPATLAGLMPSRTGRVLLTARNAVWEEPAHALGLERFGPKDSADLLLGQVPTLGPVGAGDLAAALGDVPPLALAQAGAWLAETGCSAEQYLADLALSDELAQGGAPLTGPAERPTRLAEASLRRTSPAAHRLLQLCCCFAPLPLPLTAIRSDAMLATLHVYDTSVQEYLDLDDLVAELARFRLAETDITGKALRVHRLVQAAVLAGLPAEERESTHQDLHGILNAAATQAQMW